MKNKILISILLISLLFSMPLYAQNTVIDGTQIRTNSIPTNKIVGDVYNKAEVNATVENAIAAIPTPAGATAIEDIGVYIESNTTCEFDADYDTSAVCIYRNRIYQPRSLFTTIDVSSKTRVVFSSAIDASDEIILISNK